MSSDSPSQESSAVSWLALLCLEANGEEQADDDAFERGDDGLRQVRAAFRSLVDNLPLNLLIKDRDGRRVFANQGYLDLHEMSVEEVRGKTDFDLFPEDLAQKFRADDVEILRTGRVTREIEEHQSTGGERRWIERIKGPLRDADGEIVGVLVLFWDVSNRKSAEEALDRERYLLHTLMDNLPDAIYFKDRQSRFLRVSRALADKFGMADPDDVLGKTDADIFTDEHAEQARADELKIMRTGRPIVGVLEKETWSDREDTWVSTTKMPLRDNSGKIVGTFGISRDVTELKQTQEELRKARDAADAASRAKSEFLANMSHEIRTPMNAIIGMTDLLLDTRLDQTQREYLRMVQESGESLLSLLNDVLDFSKIEAGRLELDRAPFDIRECIGDTMKSLALRAHSKGLELAFSIDSDVPMLLEGDAGRLRQILVNLVGNAIKFTDEGEVVLEVTREKQLPDRTRLKLSVRDTGVGIPPEKQQAIFEEFEQADTSTTRTHGGTGLGLAISSRLVAMMNGEIAVESEPGRGSTFTFTAEFGVCDIAPDDRRRRTVMVTDAPVLIVDDNATNRRILFDMLTNWGMQPTLATGAREGFEHLREAAQRDRLFALVLLDVNMPGVDGFEFASWVRDDPQLAETPLIMLTSAGRPGDAERKESLGVAAHLLKPVKQSELFDAIVCALGVTAAEDEAEHEAAGTATDQFQGVRVLLAEDNAVNQKLAIGVLEKLGCDVTAATDGRQAVRLYEQREFDVVLMDVQMPELDGLEATRAIRQREPELGRRTPIVAMTAHAMTGDRERCLEAGMDDYLSKPVRMREIAGKLSSTLNLGSPAAASTESNATVGPLDWTAALETVGGDRDLLQAVIEAFFEEAETLMQDIRTHLASHDASRLRQAAHTLKGALLSVGARTVSATAFKLERMGETGDLEDAETVLQELDQQLSGLLPILREGPPAGTDQ